MELNKKINLTVKEMQKFDVERIFRDTDEPKYSMCFSDDGELLAVCDHENLCLYDCLSLQKLSQVHMRRFHSELICFTHQKHRLLHSSTKKDYAIRCLDLNRHKHVRLLSGHTKRVRALCFQPGSQHQFLSAGWDNRVYIWDLRSSKYTQHFDYLHSPLVAYDPDGLLFATSSDNERIEVHDVRMLSSKPCQQFGYKLKKEAKWTQLQFAPDGKTLMVSTDYSGCFSVNAFNGGFHLDYTGYQNESRLPTQSCYTPDSQFVLAGVDKGRVHVWSAECGQTVAVLHSNSLEPVRCLQFNPKQTMFVTSDSMTRFWLSKTNENNEQQVEGKRKLKSVVHKITPIIDLTTMDDSEDDDDDDEEEEEEQQRINNFSSRRYFGPMPKRYPCIPPPAIRQRRRFWHPVWQRNEDDSPEEGELNDDD
ncbi:WD repeat-containing protein 82 [Drosophila grimshawi]|uniref:GH11495 n=1 Tax=Drosophila grimshawi TaxID=7222 RepID=B4JAT8_DROGR|nr:WD repeat-containing protein 82 [Drosophila grimshawi]EDW03896.1 GH11495 [Drosophila grimshawi]